MTEIQNPNIYASFQQGYAFGNKLKELHQAQAEKQQFDTLAPGIIAGDPSALAQGAAINPTEAAKYSAAGDAMTSKSVGAAKFMLQAKQSGDPAQMEGAYQNVRPWLAQQGAASGQAPPEHWDDSMLPHLYSILAHAGPADPRESIVLSPGGMLVDKATGRQIAQAPFAPSNANLVSVPDGQGGSMQMLFDPKTRQLSQPNYGGGQQGASAEQPYAIDPSLPPEVQASIRADPNAWANAPEGASMHIQVPAQRGQAMPGQNAQPAAVPRPGYTPPKQSGISYRMATPEEVAQAGLPAGTKVQVGSNGKLEPLGGANQGVPQVLGDPTKTGDEYLATLPPEMRSEVRAIARGDKAAPSASSRSPQAQALLQSVYLFDPTANDVNLPARIQTRKDFTSGKSAQNLRSLNQAIGHLGLLESQIGQTAGHNFQTLNRVENALARETGDPGITNYEQTAAALSGELTQVFRGNAGAEADLARNLQQLSAAQSAAQKKAAVTNIVGLLSSRIDELGQQYSQGMGRTTDPMSLLNPHAVDVLRRVTGGRAQAGAAPDIHDAMSKYGGQ